MRLHRYTCTAKLSGKSDLAVMIQAFALSLSLFFRWDLHLSTTHSQSLWSLSLATGIATGERWLWPRVGVGFIWNHVNPDLWTLLLTQTLMSESGSQVTAGTQGEFKVPSAALGRRKKPEGTLKAREQGEEHPGVTECEHHVETIEAKVHSLCC